MFCCSQNIPNVDRKCCRHRLSITSAILLLLHSYSCSKKQNYIQWQRYIYIYDYATTESTFTIDDSTEILKILCLKRMLRNSGDEERECSKESSAWNLKNVVEINTYRSSTHGSVLEKNGWFLRLLLRFHLLFTNVSHVKMNKRN